MEKYIILLIIYLISGAVLIIGIGIIAFLGIKILILLVAFSPVIIVLLVLICCGAISAITCQVRCNDLTVPENVYESTRTMIFIMWHSAFAMRNILVNTNKMKPFICAITCGDQDEERSFIRVVMTLSYFISA